tara:strand:- start:3699 stop:4886 length:1188 start_codon:yes stop_codon:yes gene_type:complete
MHEFKYIIGLAMLFLACKPNTSKGEEHLAVTNTISIDSLLQSRYEKLLTYKVDSLSFPRSLDITTEKIKKVTSSDWTSGFFAGNLWQLYKLTGKEAYKNKAIAWTAYSKREKDNADSHDVGFKVFCSVGMGLEITGDPQYEQIIVKAAKTLSSRFNAKVGSIRSWDFNKELWEYPVIIDNMMNLELLFEAAKITKDSSYYKIAVQHANTTLKNHFRPDQSTYHVVVYDTLTGLAKAKVTHQGFNDQSSWARGQAWAIYGFTMAYRYTKDEAYLQQARATLKFYLEHENLPDDGIPYWDFNDPEIPKAATDVSAGAIVASACYELYQHTQDSICITYADKVLNALQSIHYLLPSDVEAPFILAHSTGNWPKNSEVDAPIVYGDYYFLEALLRKRNL